MQHATNVKLVVVVALPKDSEVTFENKGESS
jgi:hypothetical protein